MGSRDKQNQIFVKIFTFLHVASEMVFHGELGFECNFFLSLATVKTVKDIFTMTRQQRWHILYKREKKPTTTSQALIFFFFYFCGFSEFHFKYALVLRKSFLRNCGWNLVLRSLEADLVKLLLGFGFVTLEPMAQFCKHLGVWLPSYLWFLRVGKINIQKHSPNIMQVIF